MPPRGRYGRRRDDDESGYPRERRGRFSDDYDESDGPHARRDFDWENRRFNLERRLNDAHARQRDDEFGEGWYATFADEDNRIPGAGRRPAEWTSADADYLHWRAEQMEKLDAEYDEWCDERRRKFAEDFDKWRSARRSKQTG